MAYTAQAVTGQNSPAAPSTEGQLAGSQCDIAQAGRPIDITVPDDSRYYPGENFSKTWRLVNAGKCTWGNDYAVVWFSGADLGVTRVQSFNGVVGPGNTIDVTVEMVAPQQPGAYQSNWKIRNGQGNLFGIGPNGSAPFWVRIVVVPNYTPTPTSAPPTATLTPVIFASGTLAMTSEDLADLDSGQLNREDQNDLLVEISDDGLTVVSPQNGARLAVFGMTTPGMMECAQSNLTEEPVTLDPFQPGLSLCYRTSQSLPGRMLVSGINLEDSQLELDFLTWAVP